MSPFASLSVTIGLPNAVAKAVEGTEFSRVAIAIRLMVKKRFYACTDVGGLAWMRWYKGSYKISFTLQKQLRNDSVKIRPGAHLHDRL